MDYFVTEKRMFGNRSRLNFSASEVFIKVLFDYFLHEKRRFLTHSKKNSIKYLQSLLDKYC